MTTPEGTNNPEDQPVDYTKRTGDTPLWPSEPSPPAAGYGQPDYGQPPQQPYGQPQPGFAPPPPPPPYYAPQGGMQMDPSAPYGREPMTGEPYSDKQQMVAGLLQILLGAFGAGRFYTGHTGMAIGQIAATWLTCGLGGLWPLIDGIMMFMGKVRDVNGRPLRPS